MSDLVNALQSQNRSSSVLGQIAAPQVVNPLAAISDATRVAGNIYQLRGQQADMAWGNALQQATDANGNVDYQRAQSIAAQDPTAAMGMSRNLQANATMRGQQIQQAGQLYGLVGQMSASVMKDPSDQNLAAIRAQAVNSGLPDSAISEIDRIAALPVGQRANEAYNHNVGSLDALTRLHQTVGETTGQNVGGQIVPTTVTQPTPRGPGAIVQGPGSVQVGPSPDVTIQPYTWKDARGVPQQGTVGDYNRALNGGNAQPGTGAPAPPTSPPGTVIRSPGAYNPPGSRGTPATTPAPVTATPLPAPGPPPTPASTPTPAAQPNAAGGVPVVGQSGQFRYPNGKIGGAPDANGGVRYADGSYGTPGGGFTAPSATPTAPTPTTPPPAATPTTPTPAAAPTTSPPAPSPPAGSGAVVSSTGARSIPGPAPGTTQEQEASATQYAADRADAGNFQSRIWPIVQARAILQGNPDLKTGQGAQAVNSIKSGLQTLTSIFTPADIQSIGQAQFDELGKYFQQAVNANPFSAGSDQRLAAAVSGNPSAHLSTLANKDILTSMIGLERMKQAAFTDFQNSGKPAAEWGNFKAQWQTQHDPRAFVVDMMSDPDRQKMFTAMSPSERSAFQNTLNLIKSNPNLMNTAPMPQKQSFLSPPPASPPNALAFAVPPPSPQPNALSAAA